jgi:hypothetical protein
VSLRFKDEEPRELLPARRAPWLIAGLVLSVLIFLTGIRDGALLTKLYGQALDARDYLVRGSDAPLSFLKADNTPKQKYFLQGIVYSPAKPMAVINRKTCASGEVLAVPVGKDSEIIQCIEIERGWVEIETADGAALSLRLD